MPLTGRAQAILQPKTKQAEFFASTGRIADGTTAGDAGVTTETTTDTAGGGQNLGFIEDGDYVSYKPVNLKDITGDALPRGLARARAARSRCASDSPTGTLVGTTATITPTGDWQIVQGRPARPDQPADRHARAVPRVPQPRQHAEPVQRQLVRGRRQGRRADRFARGRRSRPRPPPAAGAAGGPVRRHGDRRRRRHAHLRVGLRRPRHHDGRLDRRRSRRYTYAAAGHLHGHADRLRRPGRLDDQDHHGHGQRVLGRASTATATTSTAPTSAPAGTSCGATRRSPSPTAR